VHIETVAVETLRPYERNARTHSKIAKSISLRRQLRPQEPAAARTRSQPMRPVPQLAARVTCGPAL
jgi:hypothetical protein